MNNLLTSPDERNHQLCFELSRYNDRLLIDNIKEWIIHSIELAKTIKSEMEAAYIKRNQTHNGLWKIAKGLKIDFVGGYDAVFALPQNIVITNAYVAKYVNDYIVKANNDIIVFNQLKEKYKYCIAHNGLVFELNFGKISIEFKIFKEIYDENPWGIPDFDFDGAVVVNRNIKILNYIFNERAESLYNEKINRMLFCFTGKKGSWSPILKAKYTTIHSTAWYSVNPKPTKQQTLF
jgi:hypothetical protein